MNSQKPNKVSNLTTIVGACAVFAIAGCTYIGVQELFYAAMKSDLKRTEQRDGHEYAKRVAMGEIAPDIMHYVVSNGSRRAASDFLNNRPLTSYLRSHFN